MEFIVGELEKEIKVNSPGDPERVIWRQLECGWKEEGRVGKIMVRLIG